MKTFLLITLMGMTCFMSTNAQPAIEWQNSLGGTLSDKIDHFGLISNAMIQTTDGGYIIAGNSYSNDGDVSGHHGTSSTTDYWVVKLDSLGSIEWQKSLGGTANDVAHGVDETSDGGYIIIGYSDSDDGDVSNHIGGADTSDAWIVKLDANANIEWERSYGGTEFDTGSHIEEVNGGYVFAGDSRSTDGDVTVNKGLYDVWLVKIDTVGNIIWQNTIGGSATERPDVIRPTSDGGYILSASTGSHDGDVSNNIHPPPLPDAWVVKLDGSGTIQWEKTIGGSLIDNGGDVIQTNDGGYMMTGWSISIDDDISCNKSFSSDAWVAKLDSAGNIEWNDCYGGTDTETGKSVRQTPDGGYLLGASARSDSLDVSSNHGKEDCWIVKIDSFGAIEWEQTYGGTEFEYITCAVLTDDGGIAFAGQAMSNDGDVTGHHGSISEDDIWMVKLNSVLHPLYG